MPEITVRGYSCVCEENDCGIPILPGTVSIVDAERLSLGGAHCDCIMMVRCGGHTGRSTGSRDTVIALLIELKNMEEFIANGIARYVAARLGLTVLDRASGTGRHSAARDILDRLDSKFSTCVSLSLRLADALLPPQSRIIVACSLVIPSIEDALDRVQEILQKEYQVELSRHNLVQLVSSMYLGIAETAKEKVEAGCRAARSHGVSYRTAILKCNTSLHEAIREKTKLCRAAEAPGR